MNVVLTAGRRSAARRFRKHGFSAKSRRDPYNLVTHAIASRERDRISNASMMVMLSAFQASPFMKAAA